MLALVVASGICGLLLGWYFRIYVILPVSFVLVGAGWSIGQADGLMTGLLAIVCSLITLQACFLVGATVEVFVGNLALQKSRTEDNW